MRRFGFTGDLHATFGGSSDSWWGERLGGLAILSGVCEREVEGGGEGLGKGAILPGLLVEECGCICDWLRIGDSEGGSEELGIVAILSGMFRDIGGWWREGGGSEALFSKGILLAG